jgi:TolB protein
LATAARQKLTNFKGLNGAPAWSPDGNQLALVLSKDGNPEIYLLDLAENKLKRLTRHFAIDTEPTWMPDGEHLLFTSDRGGSPQIYKLTVASGAVERITFQGNYNARPSLSPDGRTLVMVHREKAVFHIATLDLKTERMLQLTETPLDESPTVAPNGAMLIYATKQGDRGILSAVSLDAGVRYDLPAKDGDVREPAWSPFLR